MNKRYRAVSAQMAKKASTQAIDPEREAAKIIDQCAVAKKPRDFAAYKDVAAYLLANYEPAVGYFIAVEIDQRMGPILGYIPIGQIALAVEDIGNLERTEPAVEFLCCTLLNFGDIEIARKAFSMYKVPEMRRRIAARLQSYDQEVARYVTG